MDLFLVVREVTHLVRSRCVSAYAGTCAGVRSDPFPHRDHFVFGPQFGVPFCGALLDLDQTEAVLVGNSPQAWRVWSKSALPKKGL